MLSALSSLALEYQPFIWSFVGVFIAYLIGRKQRDRRRKADLRSRIAEFHAAETLRRDHVRSLKSANGRFDDITSLSFEELRRKLATGELKAVDVLHAYQTAALKCTDKTNAVTEFVANAEELARRLDDTKERKALHGIPFSVKECCFLKGTQSTEGHAQFIGLFTDFETAPIVQFLENLGAVPFVKSNLPQAMMSFDSRNGVYGITRHPFDTERSPGGSSSGEGALVGSNSSILGVGSDGGGSLRIPAAWCGAYTLKATSGRMLSSGAYVSQVFYPRSINRDFGVLGFMTRDLDSLVTIHRLLYSAETFAKFSFGGLAPIAFREELFRPAKGRPLTIGYCYEDEIIATVPAMKRAVQMAKEALERQGHRLVEWKAPRVREAYLLYLRAMTIDGTVEILKAIEEDIEVSYQNKLSIRTSKWPHWFKKSVAFFARKFIGDLPADVLRSVRVGGHPHDANLEWQQVRRYRRDFAKAFKEANLDGLLYPAFACPALPLNSPRDAMAALSYTILFNLIDWPAGVCPITKVSAEDEAGMASYPDTKDLFHRAVKRGMSSGTQGLPVGVQIVAPQYQEEVILRLMSEIEGKN